MESRLEEDIKNLQDENKETAAKLATFMVASQQSGDDKKKNNAAAAAAAADAEKRMDEMRKAQEENHERMNKKLEEEMKDLDKRLVEVETSVKQQDEKIESQLKAARDDEKEAKDLMGDKLTNQIEGIGFKQRQLEKNLGDLRENVEDTPKEIQKVKDDLGDVEKRFQKKVEEEARTRMEADEELKEEVERIIGRKDATVPSLAQVQSDVDATQTGMKKLAEAVHVVKSSLMERIKDEKKLREKETTILRRDVERLDTKYHDIQEQVKAADLGGNDDDYNY